MRVIKPDRWIQKADKSPAPAVLFQSYYNHFRFHRGIGKKMPAEAAGRGDEGARQTEDGHAV